MKIISQWIRAQKIRNSGAKWATVPLHSRGQSFLDVSRLTVYFFPSHALRLSFPFLIGGHFIANLSALTRKKSILVPQKCRVL